MGEFSHLTKTGQGRMVHVSDKTDTVRAAEVSGEITVPSHAMEKLGPREIAEIARTARIAGIMAAKQTSNLIPYCHQLPLTGADLEITANDCRFRISARTETIAKTGVEMEAFIAATVAGNVIYDMIKAQAPDAIVGPFQLDKKSGGKAGLWTRSKAAKRR